MWKLLGILGLFLFSGNSLAENYGGKRVLYINAYHQGYQWSDQISDEIHQILKPEGIELKTLYMDTKHRTTDESKRVSALRIRTQIAQFKPDLIITSDDDPAQYLIVPYFKDDELPIIFCGINWDASIYGFPYQNVTGILEVSHMDQALQQIKPYAKGTRLGFISGDGFSERRLQEGYEKQLHFHFEQVQFSHSFEEWKQDFLALQQQVDILVIETANTVQGWNEKDAQTFIEEHIKIPIIAAHDWLTPLMLLGVMKNPREQGEWAARTALKVLAGAHPSDIPITQNQHDQLYINQRLANKLGIKFSEELLKKAAFILQ